MATADTVTVVLAADTKAYVAGVKSADAQFTQAMGHIQSQAPRAQAAIKGVGGQVGNLGAQFQDIAVQLQSGANPLTIALQQGTQISAVLGQAANPVKALGAAFLSIVSPVSLVTIGIIALGGVAFNYLSSLMGDGKSATDVLKEQEDVIRDVAERWGEAVPALRAYVDQLDRAAERQDIAAAGEALTTQAYADVAAAVSEMRTEFAAARIDLQQLGIEAESIDTLQAAFVELERKVADQTATAEDADRVLALIASTMNGQTTPFTEALSVALGNLSANLVTVAANAGAVREELSRLSDANSQVTAFFDNKEFIAEQERINSLTSEQLALENEINRVKKEAERGDVLISDEQALDVAKNRLEAEKRRAELIKAGRAAGGAGDDSAKAAERERQAVIDLIAALEFEQSLLGKSKEDQAVMIALRKAGAAATDEQRARIEEIVLATQSEGAAIADAKKAMDDLQAGATQLMQGFVSDLRQGKTAAEALGNVFDKLADKLIDIAIQNLVAAAFGALIPGGGAAAGGIFNLFGGGRASGGPVQAGRAYMVGERGPEPFIPNVGGTIVPRHLAGGMGGQQEVHVTVGVATDGNGNLMPFVQSVASQVAASGIRTYDDALTSRGAEKSARYG